MRTRTAIAAAGLAATLALGSLGTAAVAAQEDDAPRDGHGGVLAGLVADGTLTAEQADAVRDRVAEQRADRRAGDTGARRRALVRGVVRTAAEALGVTPADLAGRLRDGASIADVAADEGVDCQAVVDALVARGEERIDAAVANGRLDAAGAERARERLPDAVGRAVDRTR